MLLWSLGWRLLPWQFAAACMAPALYAAIDGGRRLGLRAVCQPVQLKTSTFMRSVWREAKLPPQSDSPTRTLGVPYDGDAVLAGTFCLGKRSWMQVVKYQTPVLPVAEPDSVASVSRALARSLPRCQGHRRHCLPVRRRLPWERLRHCGQPARALSDRLRNGESRDCHSAYCAMMRMPRGGRSPQPPCSRVDSPAVVRGSLAPRSLDLGDRNQYCVDALCFNFRVADHPPGIRQSTSTDSAFPVNLNSNG